MRYICDPSIKVDKSVQRNAFKFILHNDELYSRTTENLLMKCLRFEQEKVVLVRVN